jgi:hypothetical protein
MELSDEVQNERIIDSIMPKSMNLKERVYYWTAQANAIMLPFSLLYVVFGDNPKAGAIATGINTILAYGGIFGLKKSYNRRYGENAMTINLSPGISFAGKNYRTEDLSK